MENKYFILFSDCIPVKGYSRSIIYDLGRRNFVFIENKHFESLSEGLIPNCKNEDDELIEFLIKEDMGFITDTPSDFPSIDLDYKPIEPLSNAIIEIKNSLEWFKIFLQNPTTADIRFVEIRFFSDDIALFQELTELVKQSKIEALTLCIQSFELIAENLDVLDDTVIKLKKDWPELKTIALFGCEQVRNYMVDGNLFVILNKAKLNNQNCGRVSPVNFNISVQSFVEAVSCNSCLNRKISLSPGGRIKNCPSINQDYGRIDQINIEQIISSKRFLNYNIRKDEILICKDCEFRYMCHDCRAYLDENDIRSKPKYCNYNPYTGSWEDN